MQERNRIPADLKARLDTELVSGNSGLILAELTAGVVNAMDQVPATIVPDMPDRIIAATAVHLGLPLISRDTRIKMSSVTTIW